jgi:hypothetical protein
MHQAASGAPDSISLQVYSLFCSTIFWANQAFFFLAADNLWKNRTRPPTEISDESGWNY